MSALVPGVNVGHLRILSEDARLCPEGHRRLSANLASPALACGALAASRPSGQSGAALVCQAFSTLVVQARDLPVATVGQAAACGLVCLRYAACLQSEAFLRHEAFQRICRSAYQSAGRMAGQSASSPGGLNRDHRRVPGGQGQSLPPSRPVSRPRARQRLISQAGHQARHVPGSPARSQLSARRAYVRPQCGLRRHQSGEGRQPCRALATASAGLRRICGQRKD